MQILAINKMVFECACGAKFTRQQNLSRHGIGGQGRKPCPAYMDRKDNCLPLNVRKNEKDDKIDSKDRITYLELIDRLNSMKISEVRAKIKTPDFSNTEFVYLLIEREFIKTRENIYKIGKTIVVNKRFIRYPKNSEIICVYKVPNCEVVETEIKIEFKRQFIQRLDIGEEYFEGDCDTMKDIIHEIEKNNRTQV